MTEKNETCEQRITDRLVGRLTDYLPDVEEMETAEQVKFIEDNGGDVPEVPSEEDSTQAERETALEELAEAVRETARSNASNVLDVEKLTTYKILLSTGGPADWFELVFDCGGGCSGGRYVFQDWGDSAERRLSRDQAAELADAFAVGPQFE